MFRVNLVHSTSVMTLPTQVVYMWTHLRTLANKMTSFTRRMVPLKSDTVGILYNFPILQVSRLLKEIRNGYIRLSRICIIDIYIYTIRVEEVPIVLLGPSTWYIQIYIYEVFLPNQGPTSQRSRKNGLRFMSCGFVLQCFFWGGPPKNWGR